MNWPIKLALVVLLAGVSLLIVLLSTGLLESRQPAARTASLFIERLANGDITAAKDMAAGEVLGKLSGHHEVASPVRVVDQRVHTRAKGNGWADLSMTVETVDNESAVDVQWYRLGLAQKDRQWKVYRMENVTHDLGGGLRRRLGRDDLQAARRVFQDYMEQLAGNRYAEAGKLLVGPARTSHEAAAPVMSGAAVIKGVSEITVRPLWRRGKLATIQAGYVVDGRKVRVVSLIYRTSKGWRIVEVSQT